MYRELKKVMVGDYELLVYQNDQGPEVRITDSDGGEVFFNHSNTLRDVAQELLKIWGAELLESKSNNRPI